MQRRRSTTAASRPSIKTQRKVNQPAKRAPTKPKPQGPKSRVAPIGSSGVPLSNRFSTLHKKALAVLPNANTNATPKWNNGNANAKGKGVRVQVNVKTMKKPVAGRKKVARQQEVQQARVFKQKQVQKMQKVTAASRVKRQQTVNQRRKGLPVLPTKKPVAGKNKPKVNPKAKTTPIAIAKKARGDGKKKTPKPVTGEQLDVEMDEYWHEAGKGPDPKAAQLDRQMDAYWADKPKPTPTAEAGESAAA